MIELLRVVLGTGLFFVACTIVFLVGFAIDASVQAKRALRTGAGKSARPVRTGRATGGDGDSLKPSSAAAA